MRAFILIGILSLLITCKTNLNQKETKSLLKDSIVETIKPDSIPADCFIKDSTTRLGSKIRYIYDKHSFKLSWGNQSFTRIYDSSFSCFFDKATGLWNSIPLYIGESNKYLVFKNTLTTSSGSNPAPVDFYAIVLPKNKIDSTFEKEMLIDFIDGYLIYNDFKNSNIIHLLELDSKKDYKILLNPSLLILRSPTLNILKVEIKKNKFFIKYNSLNKNDDIYEVDRIYEIK